MSALAIDEGTFVSEQTRVERRAASIALLETRTAWHPTLTSQWAKFGARQGELATERRECKSCGASGQVRTRKGDEQCVNCGGRGFFMVDAYTGAREPEQRQAGALSGPERAVWRANINTQIASLGRQLSVPKTEADLLAEANQPGGGEPWERDRARHYEHGSYAELERALEWLGGQSATARQLLEWVYGYQIITQLAPTVTRAATAALDTLNERMPEPIRVPPWLQGHPAHHRQSSR